MAKSSVLSGLMPTERPEGLDKPWVPKFIKVMSQANVWLYRKTGGRVGGKWFLYGLPVALLTTTGRRSGKRRTTPLLFLQDGPRFVVVASQGGLPKNPAWYHNLKAKPQVELQVGRSRYLLEGRVASPDEREQLWPRLVEMYPDFESYQRWTERTIPVVILEPR